MVSGYLSLHVHKDPATPGFEKNWPGMNSRKNKCEFMVNLFLII